MTTKTYWDGTRNPDEVKYLNAQVPTSGNVEDKQRKWLEAWRRFSNGYYDLYNNGWCNWDMCGYNFRTACKKVGFTARKSDFVNIYSGYSRRNETWLRLEEVGDKILHKAIFECARLGTYDPS